MTRRLALWAAPVIAAGLLAAQCGCGVAACQEPAPDRRPSSSFSYSLEKPDGRFILPPALTEISGLADLSSTRVACVQDEEGAVYVYDLTSRKVVRKIPFAAAGDYEGLSAVGDGFFVLRSDGVLYEIKDAAGGSSPQVHRLALPTRDNEGLAFDAKYGRLLIAPKSRVGAGKETKFDRAVFAFDLKRGRLVPDPVLEWSVGDVVAFAESRGLALPASSRKQGDTRVALRLSPSSVAVHPITDEIFILSATDPVLVSLSRSGAVTGYALLDRRLHRQPEGLAFTSSGDMLISNEGAGGAPLLFLFKWRSGQP
jgi:uncharacterized protein YjiK